MESYLSSILLMLTAAVIAVPLFKRFGLASILGYLAAGVLIGPSGAKWIKDVDIIFHVSEIGVVLLLFTIGLELSPVRLWNMRKYVFGFGSLQLFFTSVPLALIAWMFGASLFGATVIGVSLAFSSTAFAVQFLAERDELYTRFGRMAFGILLFQDVAAVLMLAIFPTLAAHGDPVAPASVWISVLKVIFATAGIIGVGPIILRPILRVAASTGVKETFTAAALLLVLGAGALMAAIGGTMELGAFLAGILLAESEYKHELEANVEPIKGLLLGLFFIAIGMSVDFTILVHEPLKVFGVAIVFMAIKSAVLYALGRYSGLSSTGARSLAFVLPQGSEFAFVIFSLATADHLLDHGMVQVLTVVIAVSLALTPIFSILNDRLLTPFLNPEPEPFDRIEEGENLVFIAGFGRVGQIVGRLMRIMKVPFTALDADASQIEVLRKFGNKVYYGDVTNIELLKTAKLDKARIFVLAIDNVEASLKAAEIVKTHFPHLTVIARARNRGHAFRLLEIGVDRIWRETLSSSLEMSQATLKEMGYSDRIIQKLIAKFRLHDEETLKEQYLLRGNDREMVNYSKQAARQLADAFQSDIEEETVFDSERQPAR